MVEVDNEFWKKASEDGDVCVGRQDQIAVYENVSGDIVIRQENTMDDDALIIISRNNLKYFIEAISQLGKDF